MLLKRLAWILAVALLFSTGLTGAQDAPYTLRDLAGQNDFYVGAAVWTNHLDNPAHAETMAREFNMLTPEHEAKHCQVERQRGQFNFRNVDRLVGFAEEHDMAVHGHTLVWHQCMPGWIETGDFEREEAVQLLRDYIMTMVGRYKGRIPIWDVVNEGIADGGGLRETPWRRLIGDDYIEMAFRFAHEADPDALLFYNDYGAEGMNAKSNAIYEMASDFIARGVPIHGVGLQAHFELGTVNPDSIARNIQRLGELGLQVQITEMDVRYRGETSESILKQQAAEYQLVMDTCLNSPYCTAFIVWGVSDRFTWLRGANLGFYNNPTVQPLLFNDDYNAKPAYFAVLNSLARRAGVAPVLTDEEAVMLSEPAASVVIPEPTKSDPAQLAPDSVAGVVYYAPFPVTITLDGKIEDWDNVPRVTIDSGPLLPPDHDTAMTFAVTADDSLLYFLADVEDSQVVYGTHDPATEWYLEDSVEFYINATGDLTLAAYQPGIAQIGLLAANLTNPDEPIIGGGNSADSQVEVVAVETENGYRIEAAVPLVTHVWTIKPEHQRVVGFQAHLNGSSGNDRDTKLIWSAADTQDQSWTNPSLFGQLIFWDMAR
jgi:GH35 family endo-1,4-beta-xylanase